MSAISALLRNLARFLSLVHNLVAAYQRKDSHKIRTKAKAYDKLEMAIRARRAARSSRDYSDGLPGDAYKRKD